MKALRIAVVHDWLQTYAGSERVLEQIVAIFPTADIFAVTDFIPPTQRNFLGGRQVNTTFIQKMPFAESKHRYYLPLMPIAIEQLDVSTYDLVISSSHAVAKGVITGPNQIHISYVHSPMRYAWDMQHQYLRESKSEHGLKGILAKAVLHYMRMWDLRTANGVDHFVANSQFIAKRIWKVYRREAEVIYPPVDVDSFSICEAKEDFYLAASRLVPYKRIDLIVEAFADMSEKRLVVIGDGPDMAKIQSKASKNIEILGYQSTETLRSYLQRAKAFVFAAEEDFGIMPVEAQACGTPVIAFGRGGVTETVCGLDRELPTGVFFDQQTPNSIREAIEIFEGQKIDPASCRKNAERFSTQTFVNRFHSFVMNHCCEQQ